MRTVDCHAALGLLALELPHMHSKADSVDSGASDLCVQAQTGRGLHG